VTLGLRYSHIDATFRSAFVAASPNNSSADASGAISVRPGDRIPGIPDDSLKLRADLDLGSRWALGASVVIVSSQYARGDENNRDASGRVPGYGVLDVDVRCDLMPGLQWVASASNLLDRRYQNFGQLGSNVFTGPDRSFGPAVGIDPVREQFRAIGAPRTIWIGLRYALDGRPAGG
jgi:outer membrane receptor protein involved in Fe transport